MMYSLVIFFGSNEGYFFSEITNEKNSKKYLAYQKNKKERFFDFFGRHARIFAKISAYLRTELVNMQISGETLRVKREL